MPPPPPSPGDGVAGPWVITTAKRAPATASAGKSSASLTTLLRCACAVRRDGATAACRPGFLLFLCLACVPRTLKSYLTPDLRPATQHTCAARVPDCA